MGANKAAKLNPLPEGVSPTPLGETGHSPTDEAGLDGASHNFGTVAGDDG